MRIHKSYAINVQSITTIKNRSSVVLCDGTVLSVGKSYIERLKTYVTEHSVNAAGGELHA